MYKIVLTVVVALVLFVSPAFAQDISGVDKALSDLNVTMNELVQLLGEIRKEVCPRQTELVKQEFCKLEYDTAMTTAVRINFAMQGAGVSAITGDKTRANAAMERAQEDIAKLVVKVAELGKKYK